MLRFLPVESSGREASHRHRAGADQTPFVAVCALERRTRDADGVMS
jgi:hypothetical protein